MSWALSVRNLRTHFFTKEGVAKAVDDAELQAADAERVRSALEQLAN